MATNRKGETVLPESERMMPNRTEYESIMNIVGAWNALEKNADNLKKRASKVPGTWRDIQLVRVKLAKISQNILQTVPSNRLARLSHDMRNTMSYVEVKRDVTGLAQKESYHYVNDSALWSLIGRVVNTECLFCEKKGREITRCPLQRDLAEMYPWSTERPEGECLWQDYMVPESEIQRRHNDKKV